MGRPRESFLPREYLLYALAAFAVFMLCVCAGSVPITLGDTFEAVKDAVTGSAQIGSNYNIIIKVRIPRVICVALVGAALSLSGAAMQGLLRNPLADGTTLGVSSAASLGAVIAIAFGISIPGLPGSGSFIMAIAFAFGALLLIISLANRLDYSLTTNTIILLGVIFSMFANSVNSLIITFAGEKVKTIVFWQMGSLAGSTYDNAVILAVSLVAGTIVISRRARELNAFSIGEDNARNVGIDVRSVKLIVLITASVLVGVCVAVSGTIGFVGLVIPHITRFITGPNHKRLLPASLFNGAIFLMLADLLARVLLSPRELPIGVVTSMIGAVVFIYIFYSRRKAA